MLGNQRDERDRVMEEARSAFNNAESDEVKILKLNLTEERARRKGVERKYKELVKVKCLVVLSCLFVMFFEPANGTKRIS